MKSIVFVDTEIEPKSQKIIDIGGISDKGIPFILTQFPDLLNS